jgi:hypothetical protein
VESKWSCRAAATVARVASGLRLCTAAEKEGSDFCQRVGLTRGSTAVSSGAIISTRPKALARSAAARIGVMLQAPFSNHNCSESHNLSCASVHKTLLLPGAPEHKNSDSRVPLHANVATSAHLRHCRLQRLLRRRRWRRTAGFGAVHHRRVIAEGGLQGRKAGSSKSNPYVCRQKQLVPLMHMAPCCQLWKCVIWMIMRCQAGDSYLSTRAPLVPGCAVAHQEHVTCLQLLQGAACCTHDLASQVADPRS